MLPSLDWGQLVYIAGAVSGIVLFVRTLLALRGDIIDDLDRQEQRKRETQAIVQPTPEEILRYGRVERSSKIGISIMLMMIVAVGFEVLREAPRQDQFGAGFLKNNVLSRADEIDLQHRQGLITGEQAYSRLRGILDSAAIKEDSQ
jgi:hypothetical protein